MDRPKALFPFPTPAPVASGKPSESESLIPTREDDAA